MEGVIFAGDSVDTGAGGVSLEVTLGVEKPFFNPVDRGEHAVNIQRESV